MALPQRKPKAESVIEKRKKKEKEVAEELPYKIEPRKREPLPDGPPNVKRSINYLREKCEPMRNKEGAIAAYHILTVLDHIEGKKAPEVRLQLPERKLQLPDRKAKPKITVKKKVKVQLKKRRRSKR
jgi:hypothetical protein